MKSNLRPSPWPGPGLPPSPISEVLAGKRGLGKARIGRDAEYFGVPADAFL